jgi:GxxExxY protein
MKFDEVSHKVIGIAIEMHRKLGPGLLESAYEAYLTRRLKKAGLRVDRQVQLKLYDEGEEVTDCCYRVDLVVEGCLILEIKAVTQLLPIHEAQLLTYLRLSGIQVGLLLNFNCIALKDGGIKRIVNDYRPQ